MSLRQSYTYISIDDKGNTNKSKVNKKTFACTSQLCNKFRDTEVIKDLLKGNVPGPEILIYRIENSVIILLDYTVHFNLKKEHIEKAKRFFNTYIFQEVVESYDIKETKINIKFNLNANSILVYYVICMFRFFEEEIYRTSDLEFNNKRLKDNPMFLLSQKYPGGHSIIWESYWDTADQKVTYYNYLNSKEFVEDCNKLNLPLSTFQFVYIPWSIKNQFSKTFKYGFYIGISIHMLEERIKKEEYKGTKIKKTPKSTKYPLYIQRYLANGHPRDRVEGIMRLHKEIWEKLGGSVAYRFRRAIGNKNVKFCEYYEPTMSSCFIWHTTEDSYDYWHKVNERINNA